MKAFERIVHEIRSGLFQDEETLSKKEGRHRVAAKIAKTLRELGLLDESSDARRGTSNRNEETKNFQLMSPESQEMIRELRESHRWCCVKIMSDYSYVWDVALWEGHPNNPDHVSTIRSGSYEDLNEAVKSAYEKAMKYVAKDQAKASEEDIEALNKAVDGD